MAERTEVFKATIKLNLPNLKAIKKDVAALEKSLVQVAKGTASSMAGASRAVGSKDITSAIRKSLEDLREAANVDDVTAAINKAIDQLNELAQQTSTRFPSATQAVKHFSDSMEQAANSEKLISDAAKTAVPQLEKVEGQMKAVNPEAAWFSEMMGKARQSTNNWHDSLALVTGGKGLLGVRNLLAGTRDTSDRAVKGIELLDSVMQRLTDTSTKEERRLRNHLETLQNQSIATRSALTSFKAYAQEQGIGAQRAAQLGEAMQYSTNQIRQATQAAAANGEITDHQVASIRNSISNMRQQIAMFRTQNAEIIKQDDTLQEMIGTIEEDLRQRSRYVDQISVFNDAVVEQHQKAKESGEEHQSTLKKLQSRISKTAGKLNVFKKSSDDSTDSTDKSERSLTKMDKAMGKTTTQTTKLKVAVDKVRVSVDLTLGTLARLVGITAAVNLGMDVMRGAMRQVLDSVGRLKDSFLGFGEVNQMLGELTSNVATFGAEVEQSEIAIDFMGRQLAASLGLDPQRASEALEAKLISLRNAGLGVAESADLVKTALATGAPVGPLDEATESVLRTDASLQDLYESSQDGKIGLETITRAAQNWTAVMGGDYSELANKIITASNRMATEILEVNNLGRNASDMIAEYAQVAGVAEKDLTDLQKKEAIRLGIIKDTLAASGAYNQMLGEGATGAQSAAQMMVVLSNKMKNVKATISRLFQPAFKIVLENLGQFIDRLDQIAQSQQAQAVANALAQLAGTMKFVGPVISFVINHFEDLADTIVSLINAVTTLRSGDIQGALAEFKEFAINAIAAVALFIQNTIGKALSWGWNLIANLANGIIQAAQSLLVSAANAVGDILGLFFAPGSPPKKGALSKIDQWGRGLIRTIGDAMVEGSPTEFKRVATEAAGAMTKTFRDLDLGSFSIIKASMGPMQGILRSMVSMGSLGEEDMIPNLKRIRSLMVQIGNEFEDTGKISEKALDEIGGMLGDAGDDMKEYIELQFELRKARERVAEIDQEIEAAAASGFVTKAMEDEREEQLGKIDSIEEQIELQRERLEWMQEEADLSARQVELLEKVVDGIGKIASAGIGSQEDQWAAFLERHNDETDALEKKRDLGIITEEEYQRARLGLEKQYVDTAIKLGKPLSEDRVSGFKSLREQVEALTGGAGGMKALEDQVKGAYDAGLGDLIESSGPMEQAKKQIGGMTSEFAEMKENISGIFDNLGDFLKLPLGDKFSEIFETLQDWIGLPLGDWFEGVYEAGKSVVDGIFDAFRWLYDVLVGHSIIPDLANTIKEIILGLGGFILNFFKQVFGGTGLKSVLSATVKLISSIVNQIINLVGRIGEVFSAAVGGKGGPTKISDTLANLGGTLGKSLNVILAAAEPIITLLDVTMTRILGPIFDLLVGLAKGIRLLVERLSEMDSFRRLLNRLAALGRTLIVVLGGLVGSLAVFALSMMSAIGDAMEPFAEVLADVIDTVSKFLNVVVDILLLIPELIYKAFTDGGDGVIEVLSNLLSDIVALFETNVEEIPRILGNLLDFVKTFMSSLLRTMSETLIGADVFSFLSDDILGLGAALLSTAGLWRKFGGALMTILKGGLSDLTFYFRYAIDSVVQFAVKFQQLPGMVAGGVSKMIAHLKSLYAMIMANPWVLFGTIAVAAIASVGIAVVKLRGEVKKGVDGAKDAISSWNEEAKAMKEQGAETGDVISDFAGRLNDARDAFDKNPLAGIAASGKDVEIFNRGAEEMSGILLEHTDTYEEYSKAVARWNSEVEVESMRIEEVGELAYNLQDIMEEVNRRHEEGAVLVGRLSDLNYDLNNAIRAGNEEEVERLMHERNLIAAQARGDRMLLAIARSHGVLTDEIKDSNKALLEQERAQDGALRSFDAYRTKGVYETMRAQDELEQQAKEASWAEAMEASIDGVSNRMAEMTDEQIQETKDFHSERERLWRERDAAVQLAIDEGRADEVKSIKAAYDEDIKALEDRFAEEDRLRTEAMAQELLDINEQAMKRKLMTENLTAEEAASVIEKHYAQAQAIVDHYDLEIDAAERLAQAGAQAVQNLGISNDEFIEKFGISTDKFLGLTDKVRDQGYGSLSLAQKELYDSILLNMSQAILKGESWATATEEQKQRITTVLSALPLEYQTMALQMLDENKPIEEILAAFQELSGDWQANVEVDIAYGSNAREPLQFGSPNLNLYYALERLKEFVDENPINVQVGVPEDEAERLNAAMESIGRVPDIAGPAQTAIDSFALEARTSFFGLWQAVTGPAGSMTRMMDTIKRQFQGLSDSYGVLGQFKDEVVRIFEEAGRGAGDKFLSGLAELGQRVYNQLDDQEAGVAGRLWSFFRHPDFGVIQDMWQYGYDMIDQLAEGIRAAMPNVEAALNLLRQYIPQSPAEKGPLSVMPDWSYVTDGLNDQVASAYRSLARGSFGRSALGPGVISGLSSSGTQLASGGGPGSSVVIHGDLVFPNVRDASDAGGLVEALNDLTKRGRNMSYVGRY